MLCQAHLESVHVRSSPIQQRCTSAQPSSRTFESSRVASHALLPWNRRAREIAPAQSLPAVFVSAAPTQTLGEQTAADDDPEWAYGEAGLQGPRDSMEDFTSIIPEGRCGFLVASLFDGHAGSHAADWLNTRLYELFSEAINEEIVDDRTADEACKVEGLDRTTGLCSPMGLREVLSKSFQHADDLLLEELKGLEDEEERMAGSTATVALVRRDKIIVANVGDSRAVLCRNGRPVDLTTEHRVFGKGPVVEAEKARVEAAGGWVADGRVCDVIAVSRAFGDLQFKEETGRQEMLRFGVDVGQWDQEFVDSVHFSESPIVAAPDVTELKLEDDDEFVVIASDGLWDVMGSKDVIQFARTNFKKRLNAQDIADKLAQVAVRRHTADNVAVIVLDLGGGKAGWGGSKTSKQPGLLSRMFK